MSVASAEAAQPGVRRASARASASARSALPGRFGPPGAAGSRQGRCAGDRHRPWFPDAQRLDTLVGGDETPQQLKIEMAVGMRDEAHANRRPSGSQQRGPTRAWATAGNSREAGRRGSRGSALPPRGNYPAAIQRRAPPCVLAPVRWRWPGMPSAAPPRCQQDACAGRTMGGTRSDRLGCSQAFSRAARGVRRRTVPRVPGPGRSTAGRCAASRVGQADLPPSTRSSRSPLQVRQAPVLNDGSSGNVLAGASRPMHGSRHSTAEKDTRPPVRVRPATPIRWQARPAVQPEEDTAATDMGIVGARLHRSFGTMCVPNGSGRG